jgi:hypothetical protein
MVHVLMRNHDQPELLDRAPVVGQRALELIQRLS